MSAARAMIIWMVGEYNSIGDIIPKILPTVLKYLARCFTTEEHETKLQTLNAAVKVSNLSYFSCIIICRYIRTRVRRNIFSRFPCHVEELTFNVLVEVGRHSY